MTPDEFEEQFNVEARTFVQKFTADLKFSLLATGVGFVVGFLLGSLIL